MAPWKATLEGTLNTKLGREDLRDVIFHQHCERKSSERNVVVDIFDHVQARIDKTRYV